MSRRVCFSMAAFSLAFVVVACTPPTPQWEIDNPVKPLPEPPLGIEKSWSDLSEPPTPERVRLGRWLYYDTRLSSDNTVACVNCHHPENAFSETTPVATGIRGQKGGRKAPSFINAAWALLPHMFWDGRAANLEDQALGPIANPIEMGNTHEAMVDTLSKIKGYSKYFQEAFGTPEITKERVGKAIADYERTRMSGNSAYDRWKAGDESAVSEQVKLGDKLFFDKAGCNQCHLGYNFTDTLFHNLGVGWDPEKQEFKDPGRSAITNDENDLGAFKTPTIREATKHAPYMHDGSVATLREVIDLYDRGGEANPHLDPKIKKLNLTEEERAALVAMMESLEGEGYMDTAPASFPQ
jgi:cytochrome c peroxidase